MRKISLNIIALNILFVIGATVITTLLFLAAIRNESERLAKIEQEQGIQTFWKLLKAKGSEFRIADGQMMTGDYVLNGNFELPDTIQSIFGSTATVFMGDTRVSTNIRREDGTRAVGTKLNGPAYDAIFRHNRPYRGEAMILGTPYFTAYDPIRNSRGEIIGVLYVGAKKHEFYSRYEHYKVNVIAGAAVISTIFSVLAVALLRDRKRHMEALQENEAKYRTLFESSAEGILLIDNTIFDCNEQLCRLFGSSREEIIGKSPVHFSPERQPDGTPSAEKVRQMTDFALAGEARFFSWQHLRPDGTPVDTEVSLKALPIGGRTVLQAVVRDITEQKKADARMEAIARAFSEASGERFLHSLVEHLATILRIDYAFISEFCSDDHSRARTIAGFGLGDHMAPLEYDLAGTPCANAANGSQCHYSENVARLFPDDHLLTDMGAESYLGVPLRSADGSIIGIMAIIDGKPLPTLGTIEPVFRIFAARATGELERQRAEEALRESETRFRQIFEQNEDAIILLARETLDIIDANRAAEALIGRDKESLCWLGPWSFIAPDDYNSFIGTIPPAGDTTPFHLDRIGAVRCDGTRLITSIWGKIIRLRETEVVYCSIRDITERIRMEEEAQITQSRLIQTNKMTSLGVLVSGIAHEINNPNTFIQGNATLIESFWCDTMPILDRHRSEQGDFILGGLPYGEVERIFPRLLHGVKEGSRRISAIVNNLKDFAREDTAKTFMPIDVNRIVEDAKLILSYQIHRYTDHFRLELADNLPLALGKAQQIEQVVINLIMNALQALSGKEAGVTIATVADHDSPAIIVTVRDEGEGMSREVLERITEPFYSTRLERGGTGLGLSISAAIIREHNGTLTFESTPGRGTAATVTLPIAYHAGDRSND